VAAMVCDRSCRCFRLSKICTSQRNARAPLLVTQSLGDFTAGKRDGDACGRSGSRWSRYLGAYYLYLVSRVVEFFLGSGPTDCG
jgi:hypothetical protein